MNVNQAEYLNWVYTASMLVFLHRREETIMGESVSYQIAPGEETTFIIERVGVSKNLKKIFSKFYRMHIPDSVSHMAYVLSQKLKSNRITTRVQLIQLM